MNALRLPFATPAETELPGRRGYRVTAAELDAALRDAATPEDERSALQAIDDFEAEQVEADEEARRDAMTSRAREIR